MFPGMNDSSIGGGIPLGSLATATAATTATAMSLLLYRSYANSLPKSGPDRPALVLDAMRNKTTIYYFGVGSNLSRKKLESRSICGRKIEILSMEPCVIPDYRLAFNMAAFPPLEPAMGSLEPLPSFYAKGGERIQNDGDDDERPPPESRALKSYENAECHGALIKLSADDYERVYKSEGGGAGPLQGYEEIIVTCIPYNKSKPPVKAVAFRTREHVRLASDPCPSKRYMGILKEGAKELGLKSCYIKWLEEHPVQGDPSPLLKKIAINSMIFTMTLVMGFKLHLLGHVQKWMLFKVYVMPTEARWKQVTGEILSGIIMFPSACCGVVLRGLLEVTGAMPPMMKRWIDSLQ